MTVLSADGEWATKVLRDSMSRPVGNRKLAKSRTFANRFAKKKRSIENVKPWKAAPRTSKKTANRPRKAALRATIEQGFAKVLGSHAS